MSIIYRYFSGYEVELGFWLFFVLIFFIFFIVAIFVVAINFFTKKNMMDGNFGLSTH
jgi:hypothetical protein